MDAGMRVLLCLAPGRPTFILRDRRGLPHRKWIVAPFLRRTRYPCPRSSRCSSTPPYASPSSCQQGCSVGGARQSSHTAVSTPFHAAVIWFVSVSKHTSHRNCPATSSALCGVCRRAFGHAGVNPGHNLFELSIGQEGAVAEASSQSLRHHVPGNAPDVSPCRARRVRWRDTLTRQPLRVAAAFPRHTHGYLDTARAPSVLPNAP